jgi:hypothetical protein
MSVVEDGDSNLVLGKNDVRTTAALKKKTFGYVIINLACFFPKTVCNTDKFGTLIDIIE